MDPDKQRLISQGKPVPTELMAPGTKKKGKHAKYREKTRKLQEQHTQLKQEHTDLKKHKRERSIMYQDEIENLRRMLADMEAEKFAALAGEGLDDDEFHSPDKEETERIRREKEEAEQARLKAEREAEEARQEAERLKEEVERARAEAAAAAAGGSSDAEKERLEAERLKREAEEVRLEALREKEKIEKLKEETLQLKEETAQRQAEIKKNKHRRNRSQFYQEEISKLKEKADELESERDKTVGELEVLKQKTGYEENQHSGEMKSDGFLDPTSNKFTAYELRHNTIDGIDKSKKELYLTDQEFQLVFQMDHDAYESLALWRKTDIKKKVGLF